MADDFTTKDGWIQQEQSVLQITKRFQPPFYIETISGHYDEDDELCFSDGDKYIILHKLKIESVVARTGRHDSHSNTGLKIPLDYTGTFYPISKPRSENSDALTLREILTSNIDNLPLEVRLGNPQQHGKHFLEKLRGNAHILQLSHQVTDEYFLGKSPDGKLVLLFSTEATIHFRVKKVNTVEVKHLLFNIDNIKKEIFIANEEHPLIQFLQLEDVVNTPLPPRRPPKPSSARSSLHETDLQTDGNGNVRGNLKDNHEKGSIYEVMSPCYPLKPTKPKPSERIQEGKQSASPNPPVPTKPKPSSIRNPTLPLSPGLRRKNLNQSEKHDSASPLDTREKPQGRDATIVTATTFSPLAPPVSPKPRRKNDEQTEHKAFPLISGESVQGHDPVLTGSATLPAVRPRPRRTDRIKPDSDASQSASLERPSSAVDPIQKPSGQLTGVSSIQRKRLSDKITSSGSLHNEVVTTNFILGGIHTSNNDYSSHVRLSTTLPRVQQNPPPPPLHLASHPVNEDNEKDGQRQQSDADGSDSDSLVTDSDSDHNRDEYDRIFPEETNTPSQSPLPSPSSPKGPGPYSPMTKKKFNLMQKIGKVKWKKKSDKTKPSPGDMADDEYSEDPYADRHFEKRTAKKKVRHRSPHDDLPMPLEAGPSSTPSIVSPLGRPVSYGDSESELSEYEPVLLRPLNSDRAQLSKPLKPRGDRLSHQLPTGNLASDGNTYSDNLPSKAVGIVRPTSVQMGQSDKPHEEEFPSELCHLSVGAVAETLHKLKIPDDVVEKFTEAQIDGQIFVCLDETILDQMEVGPLNKLKILKFKNGWRPNID